MAALSDLSEARMDELVVMRRKLAGAIDPDAPKAVLEPSLVPYYNPLFGERFSWALEFRIRCGSVSYVVKDIDGMADAYVRGDKVARPCHDDGCLPERHHEFALGIV